MYKFFLIKTEEDVAETMQIAKFTNLFGEKTNKVHLPCTKRSKLQR